MRNLTVRGTHGMSAKTALQVNALIGLASTLAATAMMSLALTRPEAVAEAVAQHDYSSIALAVVSQVAGWLHALLRLI
jgi:hypothetical protein